MTKAGSIHTSYTVETYESYFKKLINCTVKYLYKDLHLLWHSWDRAWWYISIVKPTRCTVFRVYWISLYMFQTVFLSIIRSPRLYIQRHVYVIEVSWLLASGHKMEHSDCRLASSHRSRIKYTWFCMYSLKLLIILRETVQNM